MRRHMQRAFGGRFALCLLLSSGCSVDPIGILYDEVEGPYVQRIGPYTRITFNPGPDWFPAWSSDGARIVYTAWGFEGETQEQMTVNVIPSQGGVSLRISPVFSRIDYNFYPFWSEGDSGVGYVSFRGLNFSSPLAPSLTIVDPSGLADFTEHLIGFVSPLGLALSPDGGSLVYSDFSQGEAFPSGSSTALWKVEFPPSGLPSRIEGSEGARGFAWSPDSDSLVMERDESLFVIPVEGGTARFLAEGGSPAWSPDGSKIACSIEGNIFIYGLEDGGLIQVTTDGGEDPSWSPDGERIAFSWARDGNPDIYVVRLADITGAT